MSSKFPLIFVQKTDEKNYYHIYNFSNNNRFLYYSRVFISYFEILDAIDKQLTIALNFNGGSIVDAILYAMSSRITCSICVLIAITLYFLRKKTKLRRYLVIVLGLTLVITLCDQISASVIKPYVCRLRPSHTIGVCEFLHYVYGYKGGQYGFVSSHAANTLGAAAFLSYLNSATL